MKTWKLVSGIFTMLFSIFATFSGIVFGIDNAINKRADGGDNAVLLINMFFFMAGLVSVCVRKSKIAGNIAIIILYGITALIGFSTGGSQGQWTIVAVWSTICAAIAAISLYKNIKKSKQPQNTSSSQANIVTTTKQCPYCHADVPNGSAFCGSCGKELPKENICPQCGASVDTKAQFCPNCGKNLSEPIADNVEQSVEYVEEEESPIKKYLPYILGVIALIAICGGGWWYFNSSKAPQSNNEAAVAEAVDADSVAAEAVEEDFAVDTLASDIPQTNQQMKEHYQEIISKENASFYYLVDISGDGVPELFLKKYSDTSCFIDIYTYHNGRTVKLLGIGGSDDNTYIGDNHLMTLSVGDDYCVWRKYEFKKYEEYSMKEDVVYKGYKEETENFYKEPSLSLISWTDVSSDSEFNKGDYSVPPVVLAE